jgi:7-cyano-7-deazaguanine synthase
MAVSRFCSISVIGAAQQPSEERAVRNIARELNTTAHFWDVEFLKQVGGSRLLSDSARITDGPAGAELTHEWVPARNLLFLAHTAAFCDAQGVQNI